MDRIDPGCAHHPNERFRDGCMFANNKTFYRPSKDARYLAILDSLAVNPRMSQSELSQCADLSCAMVNQYLKKLQNDDLIRYERINGKSFRYVLTKAGEEKRQSMFSSYSSETVQIYSALKALVLAKLAPLKSRGLTRLALFGASETCEVVLSALRRDESFRVVGLVDNDPAIHGRMLGGLVIAPPQILESLRPQAVVISSFGRQDEIGRHLAPYAEQHQVEIVKL